MQTHSSLHNTSTKHHLNIPSSLKMRLRPSLTVLNIVLFCLTFQVETHGTHHGNSCVDGISQTPFPTIYFMVRWVPGVISNFSTYVCVISRVIFVGDFVCILIVGAFFLVTVYTSKSLLWFILEKL